MKLVHLTALAILIGTPTLAQEEHKLAKIFTVEASKTDLVRKFFGQVVAKETVDLAFQVGGQIVEFPLIEGQPVAAGGIVAQLDLVPFELALDQAKVQKAQADRTVARLEKLKGNTVSQVTIDDAKTQSELADIAVRNAQRSLDNATLHAPFQALVAARNVANFSSVRAGTPIVRLHDMSELRIEIDVPEIMFQKAGKTSDFAITAQFPASDTTYPLEVREFNAETSKVGQSYKLTFGMEPPEGLTILPGSSVTVTAVIKGTHETPMQIPASAIVADNSGQTNVMVFTPKGAKEGKVSLTPIDITPSRNGQVRVASGLEPGQEIIAAGASALSDGQMVRRFTGFAD